jgi:hypothetical protein
MRPIDLLSIIQRSVMARPSFHHFLLALAAFSFATTLQHESDADNSDSISRALNDTLLWGPYRPNIYFGVKPRLPESFISGLMWSGVSGNLKFIDGLSSLANSS